MELNLYCSVGNMNKMNSVYDLIRRVSYRVGKNNISRKNHWFLAWNLIILLSDGNKMETYLNAK